MNSIEALIAILALTASLGLLIETINLQKDNFQNATDTITAKTNSLNCAFIIDSIISNSAEEYALELNCDANKNKVNSKINQITKSSFIIGEIENDSTLNVIKYEHYK